MAFLRRAITIAGAAAGAVALTTGVASASSDTYLLNGNNVLVAAGSFESYGEHFTVCDIATDGYGARLYWSVPSTGATGHVNDYSGNDSTCGTQNTSIAEGAVVRYRLCLTHNGSAFGCGEPVTIDHA